MSFGPSLNPASGSRISWRQDSVAGVPVQRFTGHVGAVVVGTVAFDGSNRLWAWFSPLVDDAWGYAPTEQAAKQAFELWLKGWLENFRPFFEKG